MLIISRGGGLLKLESNLSHVAHAWLPLGTRLCLWWWELFCHSSHFLQATQSGASMLEPMLHPQTVPQAFCHPMCVHTKLDSLPRILNFASAYANVKSEDF